MVTKELEKTYLVKYLPANFDKSPKKEICDIYIPKSHPHPTLRIRKNGDKYEMTKKAPENEADSSIQNEYTIILSEEEYEALKNIDGLRSEKIRYYFKDGPITAEVAVFTGKLAGLVMADFEFETEKEMLEFKMPDYCLADVTQELFAAGGMLCGKSYKDIEKHLDKYGYKKIKNNRILCG